MKFVCIGDSLTYGYGVAKKQVWTSLFEKKYDIEAVNKGINGELTSDMALRFYKDVIQENPSHVVIMGGTNDFMNRISLSSVIDNISSMVNRAIENSIIPMIGIQMLIDPIMAERSWSDNTDYTEVNRKINLYREWVYIFSKLHNLQIVDFYEAFNKYLENNSADILYSDGLHPTPKGNEIMTDVIVLELI